jgi:pyruvate,water dikinase
VGNVSLLKTKVRGRARDCDRMVQGVKPPRYLYRNRAIDLDVVDVSTQPEGVFQGVPTSSGAVTGTARVVNALSDIGRVQPGEILVVNATDPGWTPVFLIVRGVVIQTGGMLSHASCLSREYGIPSVQLPEAMQLIPNGATITVNGDLGTVTIVGAEDAVRA